MRSLPAGWASVLLLALFLPSAFAAQRDVTVVALSGEPAPGTSANFGAGFDPRDFYLSAAGGVLFGAGTTSATPEYGYWGWMPDTIAVVVRHGAFAPEAGGHTFDFITSSRYAAIDRGSFVSLWAATKSGDDFSGFSLWTGDTDDLRLVVSEGDPAEGTDGEFFQISRSSFPAFNARQAAFFATIEGDPGSGVNSDNDSGVWLGGADILGTTMFLVARENQVMPGQGNDDIRFHAFGHITLAPNGEVVFVGNAKFPASEVGLYKGGAGSLVLLADDDMFGSMGKVTANANGNVAFVGSAPDTFVTLWVETSIGFRYVMATGDAAPDEDGNATAAKFSQIFHYVLADDDSVVVYAETNENNVKRKGIWAEWNGKLRRLVQKGDLAPGVSGNPAPTLNDIKNMTAFDRATIAFESSTSINPQPGWWRIDTSGQVKPLLVPGDQIEVKDGDVRTVTNARGPAISSIIPSEHASGTDGYPAHVNQEKILLAVQMNNFSSAALVLVDMIDLLEVNHTGNGSDTTPGDGTCDTGEAPVNGEPRCTLRAAIQEANALPGANRITFGIPDNDPGREGSVWRISLTSPLPAVTGPTDIDAATQPGHALTPLVILDGSSLSLTQDDGIALRGGDSRIRGFSIVRFHGDGISMAEKGGNAIEGNYVGLEPSGLEAGNGANGVLVDDVADNRIGGLEASQRNVISNNGLATTSGSNVMIQGSSARENQVLGNYIGTNPQGVAASVNPVGVSIQDAPENVIGGPSQEHRNLISGNFIGVQVAGPEASGNVIQGNRIGLGSAGTTLVPNKQAGVLVSGAPGTRIGGMTQIFGAAPGNVISGNGTEGFDGHGIEIVGPGAPGTIVQGNLVGAEPSGAAPAGNTGTGVLVISADSTQIGASVPEGGNVIVSSGGPGVHVQGAGSAGTRVEGNNIGVDFLEHTGFGNALGVWIEDAPGVTVGGLTANAGSAPGNVISGNGTAPGKVISAGSGGALEGHGLLVTGAGALDAVIQGNVIGLGGYGVEAAGNLGAGILVNGAPGARIGSSDPQGRNVISANDGPGVHLLGAADVHVEGNIIGLDVTGTDPFGNAVGVLIEESPDAVVGGLTDAPGTPPGNVISGSGEPGGVSGHGVQIRGAESARAIVQGNFIGLNASGDDVFGNHGAGVRVHGADSVSIGSFDPRGRNVIVASDSAGIYIEGPEASGAKVLNNYLGPLPDLSAAIGNGFEGLHIVNSAENFVFNNTVGGNFGHGVLIEGEASTQNQVFFNFLGTDLNGARMLGNSGDGLRIDGASETEVGSPGGANENLIAFNEGAGLRVVSGTGNALRSNACFSNQGLGIDLGEASAVTPNDEDDADDGPNDYQNAPTLTRATEDTAAKAVTVRGFMQGAPSATLFLDVFGNFDVACDPTGFGEGEYWLGTTDVMTDGDGKAGFTFMYSTLVFPGMPELTATATDASGNTSEFSACIDVVREDDEGVYVVNSTGDLSDQTPGDGACDTGAPMIGGEPECTLRAAIEESNALAGANTILFEIDGSGPHVIRPLNSLPGVGATVIDATSQPGYAGDPVIVLEGTPAASGPRPAIATDGLVLGGEAAAIGLAVGHFPGSGIVIAGSFNSVRGCHVGVGPDGVTPTPNGSHGILVLDSNDNVIGAAGGAFANRIANNTGDGVRVESGSGNAITGNAIHQNGGIGINLAGGVEDGAGVTANDPGDGDDGANGLLNRPELESATLSDTGIRISGMYSGTDTASYRIEFFVNASCDDAGSGEGEVFIGEGTVVTDDQGAGSFEVELNVDTMSPEAIQAMASLDGWSVTAVALDAENNASEFSNCVTAERTPVVLLALDAAWTSEGVELRWLITEDSDAIGFHVLVPNGHEWRPITRSFVSGVRVEDGLSYQYVDATAIPGSNPRYMIESLGRDGLQTRFGPVTVENAPVRPLRVLASPNPTSGAVVLSLDLPRASSVAIRIHDASGRLVREEPPKEYPAGRSQVAIDGLTEKGTPLPAGVYFVKLAAADGAEAVTRIVLSR